MLKQQGRAVVEEEEEAGVAVEAAGAAEVVEVVVVEAELEDMDTMRVDTSCFQGSQQLWTHTDRTQFLRYGFLNQHDQVDPFLSAKKYAWTNSGCYRSNPHPCTKT